MKLIYFNRVYFSAAYIIVFFFIFGISFNSKAQLQQIDEAILQIPSQSEVSIETLVKYIETKAQNETEKARAAFCWIANNIRYDVRKYMKGKPSNFEPQKVFKKRKAVCAGYANLYQALCRKMNLDCEMVSGYSKGISYKRGQAFNESDHVWNAVKTDTAWRLVDATWAAGYLKKTALITIFKPQYDDKYFIIKPDEFILNHMPEVPMWQLQTHPVSLKAFAADDGKIVDELKKQKSPFFNFNDSITHFLSKDSSAMALDFGKMAIRFNSNNPVPLAFGMLKNVDDKIHGKITEAELTPIVTDSLIYFTENAIKLFKKARSANKAVKEHLEDNIKMAQRIRASLHGYKAMQMELQLINANKPSLDSLNYFSNQIIKSHLIVLHTYRESHNKRLIKELEEKYCNASLNLYNIYQSDSVKEPQLEKSYQKQARQIISTAKKNLTISSDCVKSIFEIKN